MTKQKEIWYVDFPTHQYNEDVKKLAKENGLRIINSRYKGDNEGCENSPKLTKKNELLTVKESEKAEPEKAEQKETVEQVAKIKKPRGRPKAKTI